MSGATGQGSAGYERSDVSISGVVWFTVVLTVVCAFLMGLMAWLYFSFERREEQVELQTPPATRVAVPRPTQPPEPVIQGAPGSRFELQDPVAEMEAYSKQVDSVLSTSAWVDRNRGVVRIPIERAKTLLLERGLPVRSSAGAGDGAGDE